MREWEGDLFSRVERVERVEWGSGFLTGLTGFTGLGLSPSESAESEMHPSRKRSGRLSEANPEGAARGCESAEVIWEL